MYWASALQSGCWCGNHYRDSFKLQKNYIRSLNHSNWTTKKSINDPSSFASFLLLHSSSRAVNLQTDYCKTAALYIPIAPTTPRGERGVGLFNSYIGLLVFSAFGMHLPLTLQYHHGPVLLFYQLSCRLSKWISKLRTLKKKCQSALNLWQSQHTLKCFFQSALRVYILYINIISDINF